jgi:hypothetical protein
VALEPGKAQKLRKEAPLSIDGFTGNHTICYYQKKGMPSHKYLMKIKRFSLRVLPYIVTILVGLIFYACSQQTADENFKALLINISAAFSVIPLLYLFYQLINNFFQRRLTKEIYEYAKMQVDREILSIISHLGKIILSPETKRLSFEDIDNFLSLNLADIERIISKKEFLGFRLLKKWEVQENNLHEILRNPFILNRLKEEQIISIIQLIKSIRSLQGIQEIDNLYLETGERSVLFKVVSGKELNKENIKFPERYLLLKKALGNEYMVADFGDFSLYDIDRVLRIFVVNSDYLKPYCSALSNLIENITVWLNLTGNEILIDTKMFHLKQRRA